MIRHETNGMRSLLGLQATDSFETAAQTDRWLATLAHELRQPLTAIVMALEELHPMCITEPAGRVAREVAREGTAHMTRVIEDVLDLCRHRQGKLVLRTERVAFSTIAMGAIRNVGPILMNRNHQLAVSLPADQVVLNAHACRLEQVFTNLLANAANYTNPGGRISLAADAAAGMLIVRIRDNGIGIAQDLLPEVFDQYRQGRFSMNDQRQGLGLGLGLALVKSLVQLHGGTIAAYSDGPGKGSEFIVHLPCIVPA